MTMFLSVAVFTAFTGGLITVMVINCLEGMMSQIFYLILIASLLYTFHWSQISEVLSNRPAHQSFINPFDSSGLKDFNIWYVVITLVTGLYWAAPGKTPAATPPRRSLRTRVAWAVCSADGARWGRAPRLCS